MDVIQSNAERNCIAYGNLIISYILYFQFEVNPTCDVYCIMCDICVIVLSTQKDYLIVYKASAVTCRVWAHIAGCWTISFARGYGTKTAFAN